MLITLHGLSCKKKTKVIVLGELRVMLEFVAPLRTNEGQVFLAPRRGESARAHRPAPDVLPSAESKAAEAVRSSTAVRVTIPSNRSFGRQANACSVARRLSAIPLRFYQERYSPGR